MNPEDPGEGAEPSAAPERIAEPGHSSVETGAVWLLSSQAR